MGICAYLAAFSVRAQSKKLTFSGQVQLHDKVPQTMENVNRRREVAERIVKPCNAQRPLEGVERARIDEWEWRLTIKLPKREKSLFFSCCEGTFLDLTV